MALSEDLDTLCTQQLFRAAESLKLEVLDDFDCVLSQTSEAELSAFCAVGPSPSSWTDFVPHAVQSFSSTHQASSIAVSSHLPVLQSRPPSQPISASPNHPPRFALPKSDLDVKAAQAHAVPQNTSKSTNWALNIWKDWTANRRQIYSSLDCPPHLLLCTDDQLNQWLSKFILEVRRRDGKPYPPQTLYSIMCGLMRYVRELRPEINFFSGWTEAYLGC